MKDLCDRFYNETARIENMILLAGVLSDDAVPDVASELFREASIDEIERIIGLDPLPDWVKQGMDEGDEGIVHQWLSNAGKYGFLVQMATPVMRPSKSGSRSFSWGYYSTQWVYGETLDEALERGFGWVAEQRKKEDEKSAA